MSPPLQQRIVLVLGKGGVGKSVVASALGLRVAGTGQRCVIVEMNGQETQAALWGRPEVGYAGGELCSGLDALSITPGAAVEEYLVRALRFQSLYELVFRNRYIEPLMSGILGLSDLCSIGKVMDLEWRRQSGDFGPEAEGAFLYDRIVVDAPATGHGLAMLRAPQVMMDVTRVGPLFQNSRMIRELLCDPQKTTVVLVTLPEELPVAETIETARVLRDEVGIDVRGVVVNAMPENTGPWAYERWSELRRLAEAEGGHALAAVSSKERAGRRRKRAEQLIRRLDDALGLPLVELPQLQDSPVDESMLRQLAAGLEAWS